MSEPRSEHKPLRERVRQRMKAEGIPVGTDDPTLLALGARPLPLTADERLRRRGGFSPIDRLGYSIPTDEDVDRAIAIVEDSRRTHVEWVAYFENPLAETISEDVGDRDHHVRCVADYDHVLAVLKAAYIGRDEQP